MTAIGHLPQADEFGTYYLGRRQPPCEADAAIFPAKRIQGTEVVPTGKYFVLLSGAEGFWFDGPRLRLFCSAQDALKALLVRI